MKIPFTTAGYKDWELKLVRDNPLLFQEPDFEATVRYCIVQRGIKPLPENFCNLEQGFQVEEKYKDKLQNIFHNLTKLLVILGTNKEIVAEQGLLDLYCHVMEVKQTKKGLKIKVNKQLPEPIEKLVDQYLQYVMHS